MMTLLPLALVILALSNHIIINSVSGVEWPAGSYGLPRALSGCPETSFNWRTGWIFQDTEDKNPSNGRSASLHVDGFVRPSSVNRSFCMKVSILGDDKRPQHWPQGQYCLYQSTSKCPFGLSSGYVNWDDEDNDSGNKNKGFIPRGTYYWATTKIFFCCKTYGSKTTAISLPTESAFYLLAYGSAVCQQVQWATVTSEWIFYDTENENNGDDVIVPYPYGATRSGKGHQIHYCYYTSCNYTLTDRHGSFQSPYFPSNYPNGQLCSWRIMGIDGESIRVRFSNFSLSNSTDDFVEIYDGSNEAANQIVVLKDHGQPRVITSSAHALFLIFRSDETGNAAGFRALYDIVGKSTKLPPATPRTTTKDEASMRPIYSVPYTGMSHALTPTPTENSNSSHDKFKRACIQGDAPDNTPLIAIPLVCMLVVLIVAAFLLYRWRKLQIGKREETAVRYQAESVANPSYLRGETIQNNLMNQHTPTGRESAENPYAVSGASSGELYQEIKTRTQESDNPLYQDAEPARPSGTGNHLYDSLA